MTALVGLLPAAGRGSRYSGGTAIKELHPVPLIGPAPGGPPPARPVCELALEAIIGAGAEDCAIVISPDKLEIPRVLGTGPRHGVALSYFVQPEPFGVPNAVREVAAWLGARDVVLAFPDTVHFPTDALAQLHRRRLADGKEIMLGVFPVSMPEALGPVEFAGDRTVLRVHDKPRDPPVKNSWGLASWSARFTAFCAAWDEREARCNPGERALGHAFEAARQAGFRIGAQFFADGAFGDIGTAEGLSQSLAILHDHGRRSGGE
jgi:glucose-1-phosphate thymidylyltransferase